MTPEIPFEPPPRNLELANGETHVFCAALDQLPQSLEHYSETLSADERTRAARFVYARDRDRFIAGRGILREILGWLLDTDPTQLAFAYGEHGKPHLASPVGGRILHFNLAHSDALAVYAVSSQSDVGIDVEYIRSIREAEVIAASLFSVEDRTELQLLPSGRRAETFFNLWTRKEALSKAAGIGIGEPSNGDIAIPLSDQFGGLHGKAWGGSGTIRFFLHSLAPARGYLGAVATGNTNTSRCWKWTPRSFCVPQK